MEGARGIHHEIASLKGTGGGGTGGGGPGAGPAGTGGLSASRGGFRVPRGWGRIPGSSSRAASLQRQCRSAGRRAGVSGDAPASAASHRVPRCPEACVTPSRAAEPARWAVSNGRRRTPVTGLLAATGPCVTAAGTEPPRGPAPQRAAGPGSGWSGADEGPRVPG